MNRFTTETFVSNKTKIGSYEGTGQVIEINLEFNPKMIQIVDDETGEMVTKTSGNSGSRCHLNRRFGTDQVLKNYILTQNGITFEENKVIIGTSEYINTNGKMYNYIIWS